MTDTNSLLQPGETLGTPVVAQPQSAQPTSSLLQPGETLGAPIGAPQNQQPPQLDVSKSPDPLAGRYQGYAETGAGVVKGAKETAQGVVRGLNWASDKLADVIGAQHDKPWAVPFQNENLESTTSTESLGKGMESVTEFILGDEALKGLSLAEKAKHLMGVSKVLESSPKLAKAVEIGANAIRQGNVGGAQTLLHGGTPAQALTTGVVTGGTGLALEGAGQGVKAVKNFVTRGPQVEQMGKDLVAGLTEGATPEQVAQTVGKNLADAEEKMHSTYDQGLKAISAQGKNVPVSIPGSPLQQTAKQLLTDSNLPESVSTGLKGVIPDTAKIEPFLTQLSESKETLTWDQMEATRQKIGQTIRKLPWDSPIRPDLIKLRYAIDDTLEKAADNAGNSDLSDQIKSLRGDYAQTRGALDERAISTLRDKNPNAIADVLLNKQSVHNVNTLRRLIGPDNMRAVEGSILDKIIQDSSKNGELQGRQLFRKFNGLGPDAKQAIWGNRLPQVEAFMQQAGKLPNVVLDKIISHYAPYALGSTAVYELGRGDVKSAATVGAAVGLSALLRNPIVLEAALRGVQGIQKVAPAVASTTTQALQRDSDTSGDDDSKHVRLSDGSFVQVRPEDFNIEEHARQNPDLVSKPNENWVRFQASDGKTYRAHPSDLEKAKERDPGMKILSPDNTQPVQ